MPVYTYTCMYFIYIYYIYIYSIYIIYICIYDADSPKQFNTQICAQLLKFHVRSYTVPLRAPALRKCTDQTWTFNGDSGTNTKYIQMHKCIFTQRIQINTYIYVYVYVYCIIMYILYMHM